MATTRVEGARIRKSVQEDAEVNVLQMQATTSTITLNANSPPVISVDPSTSAVNVVMYVPSPTGASPMYILINRAAATGTLVVKQADGSTTAGTIAVGKMGLVVWDGTGSAAAQTVGWRASSLP